MNIIFLVDQHGKPTTYHLSTNWQFFVLGLVLALGTVLPYAGYWYAKSSQAPVSSADYLSQDMAAQRKALKLVKREAQAKVNALTLRLGQMQGHITRLDALGQKLVKMAKIDSGEFNFGLAPALGGPEARNRADHTLAMPELDEVIASLSEKINSREQQLTVLEQLLMNRNLAAEVLPSGRPVKNGWISSGYGTRTSPFTGALQVHKGIDFAGKMHSDVIAVASGVVIYSGKNGGYGHLLEISHGNGYSTRYAHNARNLVREGDAIKKGQVIALMGSTGRSTGPHVHFEVLKKGRQIDPAQFVQASR